MNTSKRPEQIDLLPYMGKWILLASAVAALAGSASAMLLLALDWATDTRTAHVNGYWFPRKSGVDNQPVVFTH